MAQKKGRKDNQVEEGQERPDDGLAQSPAAPPEPAVKEPAMKMKAKEYERRCAVSTSSSLRCRSG